jgi:hypothetical protein
VYTQLSSIIINLEKRGKKEEKKQKQKTNPPPKKNQTNKNKTKHSEGLNGQEFY